MKWISETLDFGTWDIGKVVVDPEILSGGIRLAGEIFFIVHAFQLADTNPTAEASAEERNGACIKNISKTIKSLLGSELQ